MPSALSSVAVTGYPKRRKPAVSLTVNVIVCAMAEVAKAKRKTINLDGIMVQRCCWIHAALSAAHRSDLGI